VPKWPPQRIWSGHLLCRGVCKMIARSTSLCSFVFYGPHGSWIVFVSIWKKSSAHALGGVSGVASFNTTDEELLINSRLLFSCRLCFLRLFSVDSVMVACCRDQEGCRVYRGGDEGCRLLRWLAGWRGTEWRHKRLLSVGAGCVDVTSGVDDIVCVVDTVERDWLEAILRWTKKLTYPHNA